MPDAQMQDFDNRLRRIDRRHRSLSRGFVLSVGKDGLIVARPSRDGLRFPWRGLLLVLVLMMAFKAVLYAQIGPADYAQRVERLASGTLAEQVGAFVLHADPVTLWVAEKIGGN